MGGTGRVHPEIPCLPGRKVPRFSSLTFRDQSWYIINTPELPRGQAGTEVSHTPLQSLPFPCVASLASPRAFPQENLLTPIQGLFLGSPAKDNVSVFGFKFIANNSSQRKCVRAHPATEETEVTATNTFRCAVPHLLL